AGGRPVPQQLRLGKRNIHAAVRAGGLTGAGAVAVDVGAGAIMLAPRRIMQAIPRVEGHPVLAPGRRVIVGRAWGPWRVELPGRDLVVDVEVPRHRGQLRRPVVTSVNSTRRPSW